MMFQLMMWQWINVSDNLQPYDYTYDFYWEAIEAMRYPATTRYLGGCLD